MSAKYFSAFLVALFFTSLSTFAQTLGSQPGPIIVCPAGTFAGIHSTPTPDYIANRIMMKDGETPCANIQVTYNGFTTEAENAFQAAVDIWAYSISSSVTIKVNATWEELGEGVLGSAGPTYVYNSFTNAPDNNYYASALADAIAGTDVGPGDSDITASFSSDFDWYYGTDGNPPANKYDLMSVVLHELGHGLGFVSSGSYDESGPNGTFGLGNPGIPLSYDPFMILGQNGQPLLDLSEGVPLANAFVSANVYCNSDSATTNNNSNHPKLYAPTSYNSGSSLSHWDESTFPAGNIQSLMTPQIGSGEAIHNPGPITLGLFRDMGWPICGNAVFPECSTGNLIIDGESAICPDQTTSVELGSPAEIPDGGGYGINFYSSSLDDGIFLYGVTLPYTFDSDLNGILSSNGYDLFEGEYELTGHVYTDPTDASGTICSSSSEAINITFYTAEDQECSEVVDCGTENLIIDGESAICPDQTTSVELSSAAQIPTGGGYGINFYSPSLDDGIFLYGISLPYTFDSDLNGILTSNGYDPFEGVYELSGHVYTDPSNASGSICASSEEVVTITFYNADDSECSSVADCSTENLILDGESAICPDETTAVELNSPAEIPNGGGYGINFYSPALDDGIFLYGIDMPYVFNSDLNGVLSSNGYDPFDGVYELTGHVYTDANDASGTICSSSVDAVSITFYNADNSECSGPELCITGNLQIAGDASICPGFTTIANLEVDATIPDGGGYGIRFFNPITGEERQLSNVVIPYIFDNDLNGVLSANGIAPFVGDYELTGFVYSDTNNPIGTICATSNTPAIVTFYSDNDPECVTGIDKVSEQFNWSVYPNPTNTEFSVRINTAITGTLDIRLMDALGRIVYTNETATTGENNTIQVPVYNLAKGIYSVVIENEKGRFVKKIVVE